jgi:hypothetical protein
VSSEEENIMKGAQHVSETTRRIYAKIIIGPPLTEKQFSSPGQGEGMSDRRVVSMNGLPGKKWRV